MSLFDLTVGSGLYEGVSSIIFITFRVLMNRNVSVFDKILIDNVFTAR